MKAMDLGVEAFDRGESGGADGLVFDDGEPFDLGVGAGDLLRERQELLPPTPAAY